MHSFNSCKCTSPLPHAHLFFLLLLFFIIIFFNYYFFLFQNFFISKHDHVSQGSKFFSTPTQLYSVFSLRKPQSCFPSPKPPDILGGLLFTVFHFLPFSKLTLTFRLQIHEAVGMKLLAVLKSKHTLL